MKLHIAYDQNGRIVGAAEVGLLRDRPVAKPGVSVAELEVPSHLKHLALHEIVKQSVVDPQSRKLISKP
jgi:hypothetical protein